MGDMVDGYSLEMTGKEIKTLWEAAPPIRPNTHLAVTIVPGEGQRAPQQGRATLSICDAKFHFPGRRLTIP